MTRELLVMLAVVAIAGIGSFAAVGRTMSHAIGDGETGGRVKYASSATAVGPQAASWGAFETLERFAASATDAELFGKWVEAVASTRRDFLELAREGAELTEEGDEERWRRFLSLAVADGEPGLDRAHELVRRAEPDTGSVLALRDIAVARVELGSLERARETLEEAAMVAGSIEAAPRRARVLGEVGVAQAQAGFRDAAAKTLDRARWAAASTYGSIKHVVARAEFATAQANAGFERASRNTFGKALATARKITPASDRGLALIGIATAQEKAGFLEHSLATFEEAFDLSLRTRLGGDRSEVQLRIATAQHTAGFRDAAKATFERSLETARRIRSKGHRARAEAVVVSELAKAGFFDEALEAAHRLGSHYSAVEAQKAIARAQAAAGRFEDALDTARSLGGTDYQASALSDIAEEQAKAGLFAAARKTAAEVASINARYATDAKSRVASVKRDMANTDSGSLEVRQAIEAHPVMHRITSARQSGDWLQWLPEDPKKLEQWGSVLADEWERFAEAPEALGALVRGASKVLSDEDLLGLGRLAMRELDLVDSGDVVQALGESRFPLLEARRAVRSMQSPEPRSKMRGILVRKGLGKQSVADLTGFALVRGQRAGPNRIGKPSTIEQLEKLFRNLGDELAIVRITNIDELVGKDSGQPAMLEALAGLMDNHPRVMVVGESKRPAEIDPILLERGRFGRLYQWGAP